MVLNSGQGFIVETQQAFRGVSWASDPAASS